MSDQILDLLSDWILDLTKETKQIFCFELMSESISQSQRALLEMLAHLGRLFSWNGQIQRENWSGCGATSICDGTIYDILCQ